MLRAVRWTVLSTLVVIGMTATLSAAGAAPGPSPSPGPDGGLAGAVDWYQEATAGLPEGARVEVLGEETVSPHQAFHLAFRPWYWYPVLDGNVSLDDGNGNATTLDTKDDLDVYDAEGNFGGEADLRFGVSDLWVTGFFLSRSGSSTVTRTVVFGNISVTGTTDLDTDLHFSTIGARYGFAFFSNEETGLRFGPTVGLNRVAVKVDVTARNLAGTDHERIDESAPVPALGLRLEVPVGDFLFTGDVQGMSLNLDNFDGKYLDLSATVTWRPADHLAVYLGYRTIRIDASGTSGSFDFDVRLRLRGPFAGLELRF